MNKRNRLTVALLGASLLSTANCNAQSISKDAQRPGLSQAGGVASISNMTGRRAAHTATLLPNGKVLIAGGFVGNRSALSSTEVFDPASNTFSASGNLTVARSGHTAIALRNGKVLIAGGYNGDYLDSAELYDSVAGRFTSAGRMTMARNGHVATLLNSGKVLLAGGVGTGWTFLADAELYDPNTNAFTATGAMATARESHTATLLRDGRVLITGGHKGRRSEITIYASAEIYNPANGTFTSAGNLTVKRHKHDAALLSDGRVLIVGGADERDGRDGSAYRNAEIFNPANGTFVPVSGNMNAPRYKLLGTAILLKNGKVLIAGGANRAEVFDPATNSFSYTAGDMGNELLFSTATLLTNGSVLIAGGYHRAVVVTSNAWLYRG